MSKLSERMVKGLIVAAWSVLGAFVFLSSMPHSPISMKQRTIATVLSVTPEGWNFFTRNPQEIRNHAYLIRSGRLQRADPPDDRGVGLLAGASRESRVRGMELGLINLSVPDANWKRCKGNVQSCFQAFDLPVHKVENPLVVQSLCGEVFLYRQKPIPWAWRSGGREPSMPALAARVFIQCKPPVGV